LIKFTGCQDVNGNDINDISPFNNIRDIASAMFKSGRVYANDIINCDPDIVIEELRSNNPISLVVQDIGKEGHKDYSDLSSFVDRPIMKQVASEPNEVKTNVYGTAVKIHCKELNPHGNDPVEKAEFTICFNSQANLEIVDVNTMSEYVMNYNLDMNYNLSPEVPQVIDVHTQKINVKKRKEIS
jgi:hypothetical protein